MERPHVRPFALLFGAAIGLWFPDIDQGLPLLDHRSGVTHSVLPVLAAWRWLPRPIACGIAVGVAVTLSADLFPERWIGFATIHFPLLGSLGVASAVWLAVNALGALAVAHWLARRRTPPAPVAGRRARWAWLVGGDRVLALVTGGVAAVYMLAGEGKIVPLAAVLAFWLATLWLAGRGLSRSLGRSLGRGFGRRRA